MSASTTPASDAQSILQAPPSVVSISSGHITTSDCTIEIRCHDRYFRDAEICDENGEKIFYVDAKDPFTSWSVRRSLKDASGQHIVDVRHYKSKLKQWVVEDPQGRELCLIKDVGAQANKFTALDAQISVEINNITVHMRSFDHAGTKTIFQVDDAIVAEMILTDNNDVAFLHKRGLDRTAWKLRIAKDVDMALIVALALCRAEVSHAWRR